MYALGFTPWDRTQIPDPLRELVEGADAQPPGAALDLGCGNGRNSVYLAQHGWQVTGVDFVKKAITTARARASAAGVAPRLIEGDVTRLPELLGGERFDLFFDFGCLHGLKENERVPYADGVNALAGVRATLLLMGFTKPLPPVTRGVTQAGLQRLLGRAWKPAWTRWDTAADQTAAMRRAAPAWFCFRRADG
jgi:SAM-dependent methyltransferase